MKQEKAISTKSLQYYVPTLPEEFLDLSKLQTI